MTCTDVFNEIIKIIPLLLSSGIAWYAISQNRLLKKLELKSREDDRIFKIKEFVTIKSIEVITEACHKLNQQQIILMRAKTEGPDTLDETAKKYIEEAREYIDLNSAYFPVTVKEQMKKSASSLAALSRNFGRVGDNIELKVFTETLAALDETQQAIEIFIGKFNLLNRDE